MKAGRLIELLEGVSPDAEVMCCISTDDLEEVTNMTLADFNALKKYEIFVVLNSDEDEEFCRFITKKRRVLKMNKEEINKLTQKIESCWDENNPRDVRSFDERLKQKLTPEEYELITSWR